MIESTRPADESASPKAAASGSVAVKAAGSADASSEQLMPYGAAVKGIFVKANGLPAYNKAFHFENLYCYKRYAR